MSSPPNEYGFRPSIQTEWAHPDKAPYTAIPPTAGTGSSTVTAPPLRRKPRPPERHGYNNTRRTYRAAQLDSDVAIEPRYSVRSRPYDGSREMYARITGEIPAYRPIAAETTAENIPLGQRRRRPSITVEQRVAVSPPHRYEAALTQLVPPPGGRTTGEQVPRGATINEAGRNTYDDRDTFRGGAFDISDTGGVDDVKNGHREDSNGALGDRYHPFVHHNSRPHHHLLYPSSTTLHDPRGSFHEASLTSTFPPELARQLLLAASAAAINSTADASPSRTIYDHDRHGWQRVAFAGSGVEVGGGSNSGHETEGEVWEWNGRRVALQTSRERRHADIQGHIITVGREESE